MKRLFFSFLIALFISMGAHADAGDGTKDPFTYSVLTYLWVMALSMWGGVVSYVGKVRDGVVHRFSIVYFIGELFTSGFIGVLTFWMCEYAGIPPLLSAVCIGISGHMGSRGVFWLEGILKSRFPSSSQKETPENSLPPAESQAKPDKQVQ